VRRKNCIHTFGITCGKSMKDDQAEPRETNRKTAGNFRREGIGGGDTLKEREISIDYGGKDETAISKN